MDVGCEKPVVDMVELIPETQATFALKAQCFLLARSDNHRAQENKHNSKIFQAERMHVMT